MLKQWLECPANGRRFEMGPLFHGCPDGSGGHKGALLEVRYEYRQLSQLQPDLAAPGIWRWKDLLPSIKEENRISLEEGNTPLIKLKNWPGPSSLYLKNETINPTGAYKDRVASVSVSMACELGFEKIGTVSTGNQGTSIAAYAAAARRHCVVFCHAEAPQLQMALMSHFGAKVVRGGRRQKLLGGLVDDGTWFPASIISTRDGYANPFGIEGFKTIAFEIFTQLGGRVPDQVLVPVGSGDGIYGIWKGFWELCQIGLAKTTPRMVACQSAGADPYVRAFRRGTRTLSAVDSAHTVALSIAENIGSDQALHILYESGGQAVSASDDEILQAARWLAGEGFALEPASAAPLACARKMDRHSGAGETWVAIGTGSAVKWPQTFECGFTVPEALPADFDRIDELMPKLSRKEQSA